jgi:hypothetical protein
MHQESYDPQHLKGTKMTKSIMYVAHPKRLEEILIITVSGTFLNLGKYIVSKFTTPKYDTNSHAPFLGLFS